MSLSRIKDIDAKIISQLDDYELGKVCQANKYINKICKDEIFWMNRTVQKFGKYLGDASEIKEKYGVLNWQSYYKNLVKNINRYIEKGYEKSSEDLDILISILNINTLKILENIKYISLEEFDKYLNKHELINYITISYNLHGRPDIMKYIIKRSKTDYRFFKLWDNGGKDFIFEYATEELDLFKPILEDPRSDPNEGIRGVVFRNDNYLKELLKDPRITLKGVQDAMFAISEDYSINELYSSFKILIPIFEEKGGDVRIYKRLIRNIIENPRAEDDLFYKLLTIS